MVDLHPGDRHARRPAFADGQQLGALGLDLAVTVHARLGARHVRVRALLDVVVAVPAVHAELPGVECVAVLHGLLGLVADLVEVRREVVPDDDDQQQTAADGAEEREYREGVRLAGEQLGHEPRRERGPRAGGIGPFRKVEGTFEGPGEDSSKGRTARRERGLRPGLSHTLPTMSS